MARASKKRLDPGSGEPFHDKEPRYLQLAKRIARDIRRGVYAVGELLPAEGELAKRSGLGRHTVREALRNLREVGLVSVHHGIGTRVTAAEVRPRHAFAIGAIGDFLQYVSETQLRIHRRERIPAQLASVDLPDLRSAIAAHPEMLVVAGAGNDALDNDRSEVIAQPCE